ncbi:MAG: peptide chain release factor 2 [Clostridia bacterium]|nr:peptide chain release factor 2 [Clostridia bacterium]
MVDIEQLKIAIRGMEENIKDLGDSLNIAESENEISQLEKQAESPDFWDDVEISQKVLQKTKQLKDKLERYENICQAREDLLVLADMALEEGDEDSAAELENEYNIFIESYNALNLETLLSGPYDKNNAILTLHSGAGGTEAQDWTQMLLRMYTRWAERRGYSIKILDYLDGDEAGVKSVSFQISGLNAYGYAKCEKGIHRLVRISPFDASGRRHTSFASLDVMPEFNDEIEITIKSEDLRIDTYRASGAGGQHVNKTDSAIRITHIPTGIVVSCQTERSQFQNKDTAMKMLKSKLLEVAEREKLDKLDDIRGEVKDIGWGSQIRSYVFHPYSMVKDHRTNHEIGNTTAVMDGELDEFINAYLIQSAKENK